MKRFVSALLLAVMLLNTFAVTGNAAEIYTNTIHFGDGSYIVVEITGDNSRASGSKTASKQYTYYDENDVSQWKVVLTGKFTYSGSEASCTSSSVSTTIYKTAWYTVSKAASKSGNTATASAVMGYKFDGETTIRVPVSLSLTCDANGNLS